LQAAATAVHQQTEQKRQEKTEQQEIDEAKARGVERARENAKGKTAKEIKELISDERKKLNLTQNNVFREGILAGIDELRRMQKETEKKEAEGDVDKVSQKTSLSDAIKTIYQKGKKAASELFKQHFFDVAKTPDFMKQYGLTGDRFTIKYGVISAHIGKDGAHSLPIDVWEQLPVAIERPFAITKYSNPSRQNKKQNSYRLYTTIKLKDGSFVVVGVDVKNAGRDLEINSISTVFGRRGDAGLSGCY